MRNAGVLEDTSPGVKRCEANKRDRTHKPLRGKKGDERIVIESEMSSVEDRS
jgi:hypothetical protein